MEGQEVASVNTGHPGSALAERRVLKIQTTLYQGLSDPPGTYGAESPLR